VRTPGSCNVRSEALTDLLLGELLLGELCDCDDVADLLLVVLCNPNEPACSSCSFSWRRTLLL